MDGLSVSSIFINSSRILSIETIYILCDCCLIEDYFNESISAQFVSSLDNNLASFQSIFYKYNINNSGCDGSI